MHEARPYGLILGLSGVALCCWQSAAVTGRSWRSRVVLFLCITIAIGCHYYAILLIVPLAFGEMTRNLMHRKISVGTWTGLLTPPIVIGLSLFPIISSARQNVGSFWSKGPKLVTVVDAYSAGLSTQAKAVGAIVLLATAATYILRKQRGANDKVDQRGLGCKLPLEEWAAIVGFTTIPFFVYALTLWTGGTHIRYFIPFLIGSTIIVALLASLVTEKSRATKGLLPSFLVVIVFINMFMDWKAADSQRLDVTKELKILQSTAGSDLPIVVSTIGGALELRYRADPQLAARILYLASISDAEHYLGYTSIEKGMVNLVGPWFDVNVADYSVFLQTHCKFYLWGSVSPQWSWIVAKFQDEKIDVKLLDMLEESSGQMFLFLISQPGHAQCRI
jgi:hypothetical protein